MSASNLVVVDLPKTVKKIGNMAFANCAKLRTVDLGNVIEIENNAFYRCPQLELIVIPKTVKSVGSNIFNRNNTQVEVRATESACVNWTSTWMSGNENQDVHFNSKITTKPRAELIKDNQARSGSDIKGFIIAKGLTNLTDLDMLDPAIFKNDDIVIPKDASLGGKRYPILAIADNAYDGADFKNLIIEYSEIPIVIDSNAFIFAMGNNVIFNRPIEFKTISDTVDYESLYKGDSSIEIFSGSTIASVVLPDDIEIASAMFEQCMNLENIFFEKPSENPYNKGDNEKEKLIMKLEGLIEESNNQESNNKVVIPESVKTIGNFAFQGTTSIKELHITDKTVNVGTAIVGEWIPKNQIVYVHNENHLNYRESEEGEGWAIDWAGSFTNVIFDKEFYRIKLNVEDGILPDELENELWFEKNSVFTLPTPIYEYSDFDAWYDMDTKQKITAKQITVNRNYNLNALSDKYDLVTIKYKTSKYDKEFKEYNLKVFRNILPDIEINYVESLPPVLDESKIYIIKQYGYILNFVVGKDIYYHYDNEQNRLICDNSNWNGGNGTIEQDMEPIEYTLEYDELPNLYNPNPGTFKADEYISFESVINTETGKKYVWEYMNSYSIDLSQNYEKNTIHIHGEWQDIVTNIRYKNEGGSRLRGNFPTSIKYFDKIEIGSLHKAGYVFNGWSINGNKLASSILTKQTETFIELTAIFNKRNIGYEVQIPKNESYFKITQNGTYIMPSLISPPLHIEITSNATEVYLYSKFFTSYQMYITISTKSNAQIKLHLDNFVIRAPIVEIDGKQCPQSGIYVHTEASVPIWSGINTPTSIPINPVVPGFNPPVVVGPTYPTIKPFSNDISGDLTAHALPLGGRLILYTYGRVEIYGASGQNGTSSNINGGNGACAIYCENLSIMSADNLYIKGGDAGTAYRTGKEGSPAFGIIGVFSIDEWITKIGLYESPVEGEVKVYGGCSSSLCAAFTHVIGAPSITLPKTHN